MNPLTLVFLAGCAVIASASYHHDGQWRGEGIAESQWNGGHHGGQWHGGHSGHYRGPQHSGQWQGEGHHQGQWQGQGHHAGQWYGPRAGQYVHPHAQPWAHGYRGPHAQIQLSPDGRHVMDTPEVAHAKAQHHAAMAAAAQRGHPYAHYY